MPQKQIPLREIMDRLASLASTENRQGMARYGINTANALGISVYVLRNITKEIGKDHELAQQLWASGVHEARLLACFVDIPGRVAGEQMETWVKDFDSWDLCDQCCSELFDRTPLAYEKAFAWSARGEEFVKRAGFVLMAALAVHDKKSPDEAFLSFLPVIRREATDDRNFVKKSVNWALRNIGKRNLILNRAVVQAAGEIRQINARSARWIAADALRELTGEKVQNRLAGIRTNGKEQ